MVKDEQQYSPATSANLHLPFREGYREAGYSSYSEFAEDCKIPQSNIGKFFSGALKAPSIFNIAAMAASINRRLGYSKISLDALMGIDPYAGTNCAHHEELMSELENAKASAAALAVENERLKSELDHAGEMLAMQESSMASLRKGISSRDPVLRNMITAIVLLIVLVIYLVIDASNPLWGLFQY